MRSEAEIQKTIEDHKKVENFYKETLNNIEIEMEKNQEMAKTLGGEEKVIRDKIDKLESEKKKIMDEPSNHVNNNVENRLKDFGLEKTIFDKDNEIKKLEKELELKQRTNEIEIRYLKDKNKQLEKDYEKYFLQKFFAFCNGLSVQHKITLPRFSISLAVCKKSFSVESGNSL